MHLANVDNVIWIECFEAQSGRWDPLLSTIECRAPHRSDLHACGQFSGGLIVDRDGGRRLACSQGSNLAHSLGNACCRTSSNLHVADKSSRLCLIEGSLAATVRIDATDCSDSYPHNSTHDEELPHRPN